MSIEKANHFIVTCDFCGIDNEDYYYTIYDLVQNLTHQGWGFGGDEKNPIVACEDCYAKIVILTTKTISWDSSSLSERVSG